MGLLKKYFKVFISSTLKLMQKSVPPSMNARHESIVLSTDLMTPELKMTTGYGTLPSQVLYYSFVVVNNRCCHNRDQIGGG